MADKIYLHLTLSYAMNLIQKLRISISDVLVDQFRFQFVSSQLCAVSDAAVSVAAVLVIHCNVEV